jgi:hypothetical protein
MPHLTVGERRLGDTVELRAAEASVQQHLPIRARIRQAVLLAGRRERASWRLVTPLDLGAPTSGK